jgi:hypothetical protein
MRTLPGIRHAKFIARVMALVWLFSLAVSVANACVLSVSRSSAPLHDRAGWSASSAKHAVADALVAGMAGQAANESQGPDAGQQACKSFCDAERSTIAKAKALDLSDALLPLGAAAVWRRLDASRADAWHIAAAPPPGLPLALLLLRLTL